MSLFRIFDKDSHPEEAQIQDNELILSCTNPLYLLSYQVNPVPYLNEAGINTLADLKSLLASDCANNFKRRKLERAREKLSEQLSKINSTLETL